MALTDDPKVPLIESFGHAFTPRQNALIAIFSGLHDIEPDGDDFDVRMSMWAEYVRHRPGSAHARGSSRTRTCAA